jgi:hypothetical protein
MSEFRGFFWGYLRPVIFISGFIPYYSHSSTKKRFFMTLINMTLHVLAVCRHINFILNKFRRRKKEFFDIFFNILTVLGSSVSALLNLLIILKRWQRILELNNEISKLINELSQFEKKNFKTFTKSIRLLFYYFVIVNFVSLIRVIVDLFHPKVDVFYKVYSGFLTYSVLMSDLNFIIYVLNIKIIFNFVNEILDHLKIERRKKKKLEMIAKLRFYFLRGCDMADIATNCFSDGIIIDIIVEFIGFVYGFYDFTKTGKRSNAFYMSVIHWYWFFLSKLFLKLCVCVLTSKQV